MSDCSVWALYRNVGFTDRLLLGFFMEKNFKQKTRVSHKTFKFLSIESRVAMSLQRLEARNMLYHVGVIYRVVESVI